MTAEHKGLPLLTKLTRAAFACWLSKHHDRHEKGVWLQLAKKSCPDPTLSYEEAREVAIVWGWIDGLTGKWDEHTFVVRFTPRRRRSKWSKVNCDIVEQLIADGKMEAPGLAEVERAKADGRWDAAYPGSATIEEADDFLAALAAHPQAEAHYATISRSSRFSILYQIADAKRADTRARRIAKFVSQLSEGKSP